MRLAKLPLAHPLKALTRVPWTAWLSIIVLAIWCVWAFDSATHYVAPGLLDDGSFIYRGLRYVQSGYFNLILSDLKAVLSSTTTERFYELQFALVGLYAKLFGLDLRYWYLSNFVLCLLTAGAGFCTVFWLTRNLGAAFIGFTAVLTVSPLAEAARANFGKVEVVMTMTFMLALACFVGAVKLAVEPASAMRTLAAAAAGFCGIVLLGAAAVGKESGRLLAAALPTFAVLAFVGLMLARATQSRIPMLHRYATFVVKIADINAAVRGRLLLLVYLVVGALAVALNFYVYRVRAPGAYITAYLTLNFDPQYMLSGLKFYWQQTRDGMALIGALIPIALLGFMGRPLIWAFATALTAIASCYMLLLFSFRFHVSYYAYVPTVLASIAFAAAYAGASRPYQYIMLGVFLLTRIHSIPYIYFQAAGQRYVDFVNFQAMKVVTELGTPRVIMMDMGETIQLIQEWNLLRWVYWNGKLPPIFGSRPNFEVWDYQQTRRDFGLGIVEQRKDNIPYLTRVFDPMRHLNSEPQVGDLVAARFGTMYAGSIVMRAVMPMMIRDASIAVVDPNAIVLVARVGGAMPSVTPRRCGWGEFNFGWRFYRVVSEPRYLIAGQELDGWMRKDAVVHIRHADPGRKVIMKIDVPVWMPISFPAAITIRGIENKMSQLNIPTPGNYSLSVPLDKAGDVTLEAQQCTAPNSPPASDQRPLCYLLTGVEVQ